MQLHSVQLHHQINQAFPFFTRTLKNMGRPGLDMRLSMAMPVGLVHKCNCKVYIAGDPNAHDKLSMVADKVAELKNFNTYFLFILCILCMCEH